MKLWLGAAAACLVVVSHAGAARLQSPASGAFISNGTIQLGVNPEGHLNVNGGPPSLGGTTAVGLRYLATGAEATAPGCLCEGWGAADAGSRVTGYANVFSDGGARNLTRVSFASTASTAVAVVDIRSGGATVMRVTHDYHPSPATPNLYEVTVTIENRTDAPLGDVRYRRVMDWDIEPTPFNEWSTIDGRAFPNLLFTSNDGFATANPLGARPNLGRTGFFTDAGPSDHGALFDFGFGALAAGASKTFTIYYGAAGSEADALRAVAAVGAEVWSLGQPNTTGGRDLGTPNTFIFAFGSVGGESLAGTDRRPPIFLDAFGPTELELAEGRPSPNPFTVRASLRNVGSGTATGVTTRIVLGEGLTLGQGESATATVGSLEPGASAERVWNVRAPERCEDRTYTYDVFATYAERPETEAERHVTKTLLVRGTGCAEPTGDLALAKTADPDPANVGGELTYTLTVRNGASAPATGVVLTDTLPPAARFVSAQATQGTCAHAEGTVTCSLGTLGAGATATVTIVVTPTQPVLLENTATVTSASADANPANNTARVTTRAGLLSADLDVTARAEPVKQIRVGEELHYVITAQNKGPERATKVAVVDTLPPNVDFESVSASQGTCTTTPPATPPDPGTVEEGVEVVGTVRCELGILKREAKATVRVVVKPLQRGELVTTMLVDGAEEDPFAPNDRFELRTQVAGPLPFVPVFAPPCQFSGSDAADTMRGGPRNEVFCGLAGNDDIEAGRGDDFLYGGFGNDRLVGEHGGDLMDGGAGNDAIFAADKTPDVVIGGLGVDRAVVDEFDRVIDVESVCVASERRLCR